MKYTIILLTLILASCGKLKHEVSGSSSHTTHTIIEAEDTQHDIYYGIHPDTLGTIERICNNQDSKPVIDCIEQLLSGFDKPGKGPKDE